MLVLLARNLLLLVVLALVVVGALERVDPTPPPMLVRADYPVCVTVKPAPLKPQTHPVLNPRASEIV